jgi:hypothetical protein
MLHNFRHLNSRGKAIVALLFTLLLVAGLLAGRFMGVL